MIVPWNDGEAVIEATERHEFAAILAEPVPANMGVVPPAPGFVELLRKRADNTGALLVFDEVISGFRVDRGGAQATYPFVPDLTILGKIIGGGFPAAAYGGPRSLMERIAPAGDVYQAGTLSGNPVACAAGLATITQLNDAAYEQLDRTTKCSPTACARPPATPAGRSRSRAPRGSLTVFFADEPVRNYAEAAACDLDAYGAWCRALLDRGVYPPASQFEAWFPSLAHSDAELDRTIEAARAAFAEIA